MQVSRETIIQIAKENDVSPYIVEKGIRLFDVLDQMMHLLDGRVILDGGASLNMGRAKTIKPRITRDLDLIYDGDIEAELNSVVGKLSKLKGYILGDNYFRGQWAYNFYLRYRNIDYCPEVIWFEFYHSRPPAYRIVSVVAEFPLMDLGQIPIRAVSLADVMAIKLDALSKHTRWQDVYDLYNILPRMNNMNDIIKVLENYNIDEEMWRRVFDHLEEMQRLIDQGYEYMQARVPKQYRILPLSHLLTNTKASSRASRASL